MEGFDVLVVGGGTAGCVLASGLSEDPGRSVCLVEAGPDYGAFDASAWPPDLLDARALAFSHSWLTDREDRSQLRARVIGGCSAHNACIVLEGHPSDYDEWGPGWSYNELEPYLRKAQRELRTRRFRAEELSPWHRAFVEAGGSNAIVHGLNAVGTVRWNASFAYLDRARNRENLTILADTLVDRVVLDGDRATGVVTGTSTLKAETVVLAAGAYGSAGILLRSGIGPERGLPVGENLTDHVGTGLAFEPTVALLEELGDFERNWPLFMGQVSVLWRSGSCPEGMWDLLLLPATDPGPQISAGVFMMKPRSRGRLSLASRDPEVPLVVEHGFLTEASDAEILTEGVEALRTIVAEAPIGPKVGRELRPGPQVEASAYVRATARGFFHPTGTCAIGSVVDALGRMNGHEGLVVGDASIMPTIPRAPTNITVAAVAERLAETI